MVWFQCESCGENLKKPKLQNHFRACAARKLSCIDCGVVFDQQSVQAHTSCVTEEEKYGPKGAIKSGGGGSAQKVQKGPKPNIADNIDLSMGLASKPPWTCSLCNVSATSFETLEGHSQGKKHRSKVKAALWKLNPTVLAAAAAAEEQNVSAGVAVPVNAKLAESGTTITPEKSKTKLEKDGMVVGSLGGTPSEQGDTKIRKKRKAGAADTRGQENVMVASENLEADVALPSKKKRKEMTGGTMGSGEDDRAAKKEMRQANGQENVMAASKNLAADVALSGKKKRKEKKGSMMGSGEDDRPADKELDEAMEKKSSEGKEENGGIKHTKSVNWNKIFTKVLAKSPNGSMKTRSLMKDVLVVEASKLSPNFPEKKMLEAELLNQLRKSSKFVVEGKVVRLAKPLRQQEG